MKRLSASIMILLILALLLTGCVIEPSGYYVTQDEYDFLQSVDITAYEQISNFQLLMEVLGFCNENYFYDLDISRIDISAAMGVINNLDRYSSLQIASGIATSSAGIGLRLDVTMYNEYRINYIHPQSPAADSETQSGYKLMRGDYIYKVNGDRVEGADISYFNQVSKGGVGSKMILTIKRDGVILDETFECTKVGNIFNESYYIDNILGLPDEIGYIRLLSFTGNAKEDFIADISNFIDDDNEFLILDLRGNGGGSSDILQDIAGYLIDDGNGSNEIPIIELSTSDGHTTIYKTKENNYIDVPIAVLVNGATASASEALVSAISYYGTGVLIGETTFGKGTALNSAASNIIRKYNTSFYLSVVVGEYSIYTHDLDNYPNGTRNIEGVGIVPDYLVNDRGFESELADDHDIKAVMDYFNSLYS